jgi:DNA-nicking Smr family endonuclease
MNRGFYKPFGVLKALVKEEKRDVIKESPKTAPPKLDLPDGVSDEELFQAAMKDVRHLGWSAAAAKIPSPVEITNKQDTELEALRLLEEFISDKDCFDITSTGEYVERLVQPVGRWLLRDLHAGRFSVQAHLDLHGQDVMEARCSVEKFIKDCIRSAFGCVRIVHGRGHHSLNGRSVLKEHVQKWLTTRRMRRYIVAFTSARSCDGGGGALYVLLRTSK